MRTDDSPESGRISPVAELRRFAAPRRAVERCELCRAPLGHEHRHLLETSRRRIICACDPCALRFQDVVNGRFQLIPRDARALGAFRLSDAQWDALNLPINLAFFVRAPDGSTRAFYPSPAGAVEALVPAAAWERLAAENPPLDAMARDVEALLVNRVGARREAYLAPLDACFELVGIVRARWKGLSGGDEVWRGIDEFFDRLRLRARPSSPPPIRFGHA